MRFELDKARYNGVTAALRDRLFAFVDQAELKAVRAGDYTWPYLDYPPQETGATGAPPVVFFSGGAKHPVYSFAVIEALGQHNRVIALAQPPCPGLDEHFAGVDAVLQREGVERFHAAGSSWGGCLAQAAAVRFPGRVCKMVLSSTGLAGGKAIALMLRLHLASVRGADSAKVVAGFRKRALVLLAGDAESKALWQAMFDDVYDRLFTHRDYVSLISSQLDYVSRYAPRVASQAWPNPVLVLTARDETAGSTGWRRALRRAYPAGRFHLFEGGGHHPALQHRDEYRRVVASFLAEED